MSVRHITWVWEHSRAEGGALLVALALADSVNSLQDGDECWPKREQLARMVRLSESQVSRCLKELESLGEIERQRTRNGNHYRMLMPDVRKCDERTDAPRAHARSDGAPTPDLNGAPTLDPRVEPEVKPRKEPEEDDIAIFQLWCELAEAPPTATLTPARRRQIKTVRKEEPDVAIVQQALRGYAAYLRRKGVAKRWEISDAFQGAPQKDADGRLHFPDPRSRINWLLSIDTTTNGHQVVSEDKLHRWLDEIRYHLEKQAITPGSTAGRDRAVEAYQKLKAAGLTIERLAERPFVRVGR